MKGDHQTALQKIKRSDFKLAIELKRKYMNSRRSDKYTWKLSSQGTYGSVLACSNNDNVVNVIKEGKSSLSCNYVLL